MKVTILFLLVCTFFCNIIAYKIGRGIYDVTGPAAEVNFMGYAVPGQRGQGIKKPPPSLVTNTNLNNLYPIIIIIIIIIIVIVIYHLHHYN